MPLHAPDETRAPASALAARTPSDESRLAHWLEKHVTGEPHRTLNVRQFKGGQSNPTFWLGIEAAASGQARELVLRRKPAGVLLPSAHAIEREYRVMKALAPSGFPVPQMLAQCDDETILGTPFFVMTYVPGRIYWDPALPDVSSPETRGHIHRAYIEALAQLHTLDYRALGLSDYGKAAGYVPRQVARWSSQYEASRTDDIPAMNALMAFVRERVPTNDETTLIHGDYRLDNLVFDDTPQPRVRAVLDWELSTLGHPASDLAYACLAYHINIPGRGGLLGVDLTSLGIPTEQEAVDAYCTHTKRTNLDDYPYFVAFGIFRLAAIAQGVFKRSLQGNASSDSAGSFGAAVKFLAELGCSVAKIASRPQESL
jgi:aminoglycoside phosphotransferase (APT) family kinase protein